MAQRLIRLTTSDRHRLFVLISAAHRRGALDRARARDLEGEIRKAEVVTPPEAPPDLITMRTTFRLTDLDSGDDSVYTLVYPHEADLAEGRLSVLAPLGTAVLGQRVGIGRNRLVELGMAALFHDIGKSRIPLEVLNKPAPFNEQEWTVMRRHPVLGVKELLKLKGVDALTARIMQGSFEHHLNLDGSGYPRVEYPRGVSLGGRIVAIADCYDALTSSRVYRRTAETPETTLRYILQKSGTLYDPILVKLFVNALGVYPAGTRCQLSSGELGVVMQSNPDPEQWERPRVKVIATPDGTAVDGAEVDLAAPGIGLRIARTLDARRHGIDVARYFL
jgi:hypothetical protein